MKTVVWMSDSGESDIECVVILHCLSVSPESVKQSVFSVFCLYDSGESDVYGMQSGGWMSVSPESDTLRTRVAYACRLVYVRKVATAASSLLHGPYCGTMSSARAEANTRERNGIAKKVSLDSRQMRVTIRILLRSRSTGRKLPVSAFDRLERLQRRIRRRFHSLR